MFLWKLLLAGFEPRSSGIRLCQLCHNHCPRYIFVTTGVVLNVTLTVLGEVSWRPAVYSHLGLIETSMTQAFEYQNTLACSTYLLMPHTQMARFRHGNTMMSLSNHDVFYKTMMHFSKPWCILANHDVFYQTMTSFIKPWCLLANHDAFYKTIVSFSKPWCFLANHDVSFKTMMSFSKPWCLLANHDVF